MPDLYQIPLDMPRTDKEFLRWERMNTILRMIFQAIANIDGRNGPIAYKNDLGMDGHQISGGPAQARLSPDQYVTKSYFESAEFGRMVVSLLAATGKTPLPITGSVGSPSPTGGGGGGTPGVTDHALLTDLAYAVSGHTGFVPSARTISTTGPLSGGGNLSADRTLAISQAGVATDGYLSSADWNTFAGFSAKIGGSGTAGKLAKFTAAATIGDSVIKESAGKIGVATTGAPAYTLEVEGQIKASLGSILPAVKALVDAATVATDASLGNHFRVTLGGDRTLGNPSNAVDGQRLIWEITQDGTGNRILTLDTKFVIPSNIPDVILSLGAGKTDMIGVVYNVSLDKSIVTGFLKEYA